MTTREDAARARAEGMAARADRPRQRRSADGGPALARVTVSDAKVVRSNNGSSVARFSGYASVTETPYTVWDMFGEYVETVARGAWADTLSMDGLLVEFVANHGGLPMAHTRNATLTLTEDEHGLRVEADVDPSRHDVHDMLAAVERGDLAEMSFRFQIDAGEWSPDWEQFRITKVNMHRGDVSVVNFGANPHTHVDLPARADAAGDIEARDDSSAATDALGDEPPAAPPTEHEPERSAVMDDATVVEPAQVEPTPTPTAEVREDLTESLQARVADLEEQIRIRRNAEEAQRAMPHYDEVARVGAEERTYRPDQDPKGGQFVRDVITASLGDYAANERLARHMSEERTERGPQLARAAATSAFAGLVVPQYLTELVAPAAKAGRPFADAVRKLPLPADGMTVNISKITTATSTAVQTEGTSVSETDIDDTLLSPTVQTIAGSQTVTRQAVERGSGALEVVLEDLARNYSTTLDSTLLNQATNGLTNVATGITYTDTNPTAAELYPKVLQGIASVEAALLDQDPGDTIVVMHSRRWYWLQSQLSSTFPLIGQGFGVNVAGQVDGTSRYGSGFRGLLPSGTPVVVDNNITTTDGTGTNQDEIYFVSASEIFLWENPDAPMLIRTDTGPSVKSLGVDVVVYGYAAYTHVRRAHAYKIAGTGLVTPTWA